MLYLDRKAIQEQRKRGYFIEAAKKIIREEGVEKLTVKKVADLAGFAPGTLYNYFADINELLYFCAGDFWEECRDNVFAKEDKSKDLKRSISEFSKAYTEYFINNPNIFELMFLKDFNEFIKEAPEPPEVAIQLHNILKKGAKEGLILEDKLEVIEELIGNSIHGLLLFYIKKRSNASKEEILKLIEEEIDFLL
ncbi:MAG: TetR/AcrR family transcriptional regulator [Bacillota bacterium]